ncbi:MAG: hypothetical protein ABIT37_15865 [Luteolibacter sp.]
MNTRPRIFIVCTLLAIGVFWAILLFTSRNHPLAKALGLPTVEDNAESTINQSERVLVFAKKGVDYDLYEYICNKASAMYGEKDFRTGVEIGATPRFDLIDAKYSQNQHRAFEIVSRDRYSSIFVIEYDLYVVVVLADARI